MSIITKKGDEGFTTLYDGSLVLKSDDLPKTYGLVDELFSFLGIVKFKIKENNKFIKIDGYEILDKILLNEKYKDFLSFFQKEQDLFQKRTSISFYNLITLIQKRLIYLMSEIAVKLDNFEKFCIKNIDDDDITILEIICYSLEKEIGKINSFLIPGENEIESLLNYARTITRKVERQVVEIREKLRKDTKIIKYLNRLSDLLFLMAFYYYKFQNNC